MRFQNIKVSDAGVELDRLEKGSDGSLTKTSFSNPSKPLPPFTQAMQAFSGYAVDLIDAKEWHEDVRVSSIHLSEEPKTNRRGLIVTFTRRIAQAKNRVVVVNTPLMHAPVDDQEGTNPGTFPREVAKMIDAAEREATKYWNGEREQSEMFAGDAAEQQPDISPATTKQGRKPKTAGTPGEVMNADKSVPPTDEAIRQVLLTAGRDVPVDAIAHWNSQERDEAQRWATAVIEGVLNQKPTKLKEPPCVKKSATLPLSAEEHWDEPNPLAGKAKDVQPAVSGD